MMLRTQLNDLEQRCYKAAQKGHLIGKGEDLAAMLMTECGEVPAPPHPVGSPEHLLKIIQAVKDVRSGKTKKVEPEPKKAPAKKVQDIEDKLDGEASMAAKAEGPPIPLEEAKKTLEEPPPIEPEPEPDKGKKGKSKKGG